MKKAGENLSSSARAILLLRQADLTDVDHQIIIVNLEFDPNSPTADTHYEKCKASMERFQHSKVANNQVIGQKQSAMATFLACLEDREDFDQELADSIKTFLSTASTKRGGRGRGGRRGGTRGGGYAGNTNTKTKGIWKCDYCLCDCFPKWVPCECACSSLKKEECPKPNPARIKAYRKRKAEQEQEKSAKNPREEPEHEGTSFITFFQEFGNQSQLPSHANL